MENQDFLQDEIFKEKTTAALNWLKRSFDANGDNGSSAYYTQLWKPFGWEKSYPETTGYIITTLLDYDNYYPDMHLKDYAIKAADWICTLQMSDGSLPGGYADSLEPSIFNTGQMILGLTRVYELTKEDKYLNVLKGAVNWLVEEINPDGSWTTAAYIKSYTPSYYTRVIWPILWANKHINNENTISKMKLALQYYESKITEERSVRDWAFKKDQKAFTHTIAYTIRGFYESSLLLDDSNLNDVSIKLADKVMELREFKGKLAGWYDSQWNGDYSFLCVTGNCQISIILSKIFQQTGDIRYLNTSLKVFGDVVNSQNMKTNLNKRGAIPGSQPFYGRYLIFRYPNWATKFYLDAYRLLYENVNKLKGLV